MARKLLKWRIVLHWRTWRRELRWARNDHHGHFRPDSTRHDKTDDQGRDRR